MTKAHFLTALLSAGMLLAPATQALAQSAEQSREEARLITATQVLDELRETPDNRVPDWLMQRAYGVAVIPEVIKGAFIFGGRYGNGVMIVRDSHDRFGNPIFVKLIGGSVGWQVGATSTDVVLIFVTPRSVQNFARGKFTLGVDASVAAGPMGRQGEAAAGVNAEVYSYSRSRGLFAGVALDGTALAFDKRANEFFYNNESVTTEMITSGKVTAHSETAQRFVNAVMVSTKDNQPPGPGSTTPSAPPPNSAPPAAGAQPPSGVKTFPIEDPHPGGEPK
ncbi:MAG TPA: lipid-binding SYLF domain-containing protein [Steroidobacteraceae bacterium]|nr:lipid-binding SYLF domain-containing protein [Steroidobacteraceae bacterium]